MDLVGDCTEKQVQNSDQVFIKDHWICNFLVVVIEEPDVDILKKIKIARSKDKEVIRIVEEIKRVGVKELRDEEWQIERKPVLKKGKVYIPKDEELRVEIIQLHYDILVAGYGGKQKITELVTRNYWQLEVMRDVE